MKTKSVYCLIPSLLSHLGFAVTLDSDGYNAIDSDGYELGSFASLDEAVEHFNDIYEELIASETMPIAA